MSDNDEAADYDGEEVGVGAGVAERSAERPAKRPADWVPPHHMPTALSLFLAVSGLVPCIVVCQITALLLVGGEDIPHAVLE